MSETRNYDVEGVVAGWMGTTYIHRNELLRLLYRPFSESAVIKLFVDEIVTEARASNCQAIQLVAMGLMYGMVTGIFVEDERRSRKGPYGFSGFDVAEVVQQFLKNQYPERRELVAMFTGKFRDSDTMKRLTAQIGTTAVNNKLSINETVALGLRHGMGIGIMLEKDRTQLIQ